MPSVNPLNISTIQATPTPLESATSSPTKVREPSRKPTMKFLKAELSALPLSPGKLLSLAIALVQAFC